MAESKRWVPSRWTPQRAINCLHRAKRSAINYGAGHPFESPEFIGAAEAIKAINYAVSLLDAENEGLEEYFPKRG